MNVVHTGLEADCADAWYSEHLASLFVSDIAAVDDPPVRLLNAVAADWIIEKEGKIAEQIKLVVLRIGIGKELTV